MRPTPLPSAREWAARRHRRDRAGGHAGAGAGRQTPADVDPFQGLRLPDAAELEALSQPAPLAGGKVLQNGFPPNGLGEHHGVYTHPHRDKPLKELDDD